MDDGNHIASAYTPPPYTLPPSVTLTPFTVPPAYSIAPSIGETVYNANNSLTNLALGLASITAFLTCLATYLTCSCYVQAVRHNSSNSNVTAFKSRHRLAS